MTDDQRTLCVYAGEPIMDDPTLTSRLAQMSIPAMVVWVERDRIVDPVCGYICRQHAGRRFEFLTLAGHFPSQVIS